MKTIAAVLVMVACLGAGRMHESSLRITPIKSLIEKLPADARPPRGGAWQEIHDERVSKWLTDEYKGKEISGRIKITKIGRIEEQTITCDAGPEYFELFGLNWTAYPILIFPDSFEDDLAKMKTPKEVNVLGMIDRAAWKRNDNGTADLFFVILVREIKNR